MLVVCAAKHSKVSAIGLTPAARNQNQNGFETASKLPRRHIQMQFPILCLNFPAKGRLPSTAARVLADR
jgi:hypothetical protein